MQIISSIFDAGHAGHKKIDVTLKCDLIEMKQSCILLVLRILKSDEMKQSPDLVFWCTIDIES